MNRQLPLPTAILLLASLALTACGTTGATSRFALSLDRGQSPQVTSEIRVASGAMDDNAAQLIAVNVKPWGKFDPDDLRNIEESLRDTMATNIPTTSRSSESRLDIHLVVRRYIVSTSNTGVAVLACVAWAATSSQGALIFEEQFYAWEKGTLIVTVGLIKDSVHKAMVRRIATTSIALATGPGASGPEPTAFENTSTSLEEAASQLPRKMVSMGNPYMAAFPVPAVSAIGLLTPSGVAVVQWDVARQSDIFDWKGYLGKLYTSP